MNKLKKNNEKGRNVLNYMGLYLAELHKNTSKREIWTDFSASDVNINDIDTKLQDRELKESEIRQFEVLWGKQKDVNDYTFLEQTFDKYTENTKFVNYQQEDLYRDLCRDRLLLRKINDSRYDGDETIDKIQNRISRTMSTLKVDEFESNKPKTTSELLIFEKIKTVDENNVKDIYKEPRKFEDFNKYRKYQNDLVLRPLKNTLAGNRDFNINIDNIEEYDLD